LQYYSTRDAAGARGFRTIFTTDPAFPYAGAWWPAGHMIGWEHSFTHEVFDVLTAIENRGSVKPDFEDGYRCQRILDAVLRSIEAGEWVSVG
jgi:predicted dehydrogenase